MYNDPSIISPLHVLIPAGIALLVLLIAWRPWTRKEVVGSWGGPVAIAAAFAGVYQWIVGQPAPRTPDGAPGSFFHIAVGMGVIGIIDALLLRRVAYVWRLIGAAVCFAIAFSLVLRRPLTDVEMRQNAMLWIGITTALGAVWWLALQDEPKMPSPTRALPPAAMTLLAIAVAMALVLSGTVTYGRLTLAVGGAAGSMLILALLRRSHSASPAVPVATALLLSLLLGGFFFAEISPTTFFAIGAAPLLLLMLRPWRTLRQSRPLLFQLLSLLLLLAPLAASVGVLLHQFIEASRNADNPYGL